MNPDRWQNLVAEAKLRFQLLDEGEEELENMPGSRKYIVFESPMGRLRLEFVTKPIVLDKKVIHSKRIGSEAKVEYTYSDSEVSTRMHAYRWNETINDWEEIRDADVFLKNDGV